MAEVFENAGEFFLVNADASVKHLGGKVMVALVADVDLQEPIKGELDWVRQQVEKHLFEPLLVWFDELRHFVRDINVQLQVLLLHLELNDGSDILHSLSHVEEVTCDPELLIFKPGHVQTVLNNVL